MKNIILPQAENAFAFSIIGSPFSFAAFAALTAVLLLLFFKRR